MTTKDSERRRGPRQPICIPVKVLFLGHRIGAAGPLSASMRTAPAPLSSPRAALEPSPPPPEPSRPEPVSAGEESPLHALAIDVSAQGFQIEVSGLAGRRFRQDEDMLPGLEVRFANEELRHHGPCTGRVRWSRHEGRSGWRLGVQLDRPLAPEALEAILALGQPREPKGRLGRDLVCAAVAAAVVSALWLPAHRSASAERDQALMDKANAEAREEHARAESLACAAERAADQTMRTAPTDAGSSAPARALEETDAAIASENPDAGSATDAAPVRREEIVRGLLERAFQEADAASARSDDD